MLRLVLTTIAFILFFNPTYADQIPDKAVQSSYCEGVISRSINTFYDPASKMDCPDNLQHPETKGWCLEQVNFAKEKLYDLRNRMMKMENYVEIYMNKAPNTTSSIQNFFFMGQRDYDEGEKNLNDISELCTKEGSFEKAQTCIKRTPNPMWSKTQKCLTFDPTDF